MSIVRCRGASRPKVCGLFAGSNATTLSGFTPSVARASTCAAGGSVTRVDAVGDGMKIDSCMARPVRRAVRAVAGANMTGSATH